MKEYKYIFFLLISLAIFWSFGFFHLAKFETADEHFWFGQDRIQKYWRSLSAGDFKGTRISDKPGISLAWVSGIGMLFEKENNPKDVDGLFFRHDSQIAEHNNFVFRLPLLIFSGLFAFFFFWILRKIFDDWIALWSTGLMLLSPILLGISQIVNPDALSWIFMTATILSYLAYLKKEEMKYFWLSALFLGLMLSTKYIGAILFPFLFLLSILWIYFDYAPEKNEMYFQKIKKIALAYFGIIFSALIIFSLLMPAVFVKSQYLFKDLIGAKGMDRVFWPIMTLNFLILADAWFGKSRSLIFVLTKLRGAKKILIKIISGVVLASIAFVLINGFFKLDIWQMNTLPFDLRQGDLFAGFPIFQKFILQFRPLVFSLTPPVLFFFLLALFRGIFRKAKYEFEILALALFTLIYYAAVTYQNLLVTIRYGIILYPLAMILAAIGLAEFLEYFPKLKKEYVFAGLILAGFLSLWPIKPFYFNYANGFLPKEYLITGAWGYGGYEAAQFLNNLPDAENITVVSDYSGVCGFVKGKCVEMSNDVRGDLIKRFSQGTDGWYFVETRRGQVRWNYIHEFNQFNGQKPLWELQIDNRPGNYVKIFRQ